MYDVEMGSSIGAPIILGWLLFGGISVIALGYAKLKEDWRPALLGIAIGVYPYFVPNGWLFWALGIGGTVALFLWRE